MSQDQPCLKPSFYQGEGVNYFEDEIRQRMTPCPTSEYFDTVFD